MTAQYIRKGRTGKTETKIKAKLSETLLLTYQDKNKSGVTIDAYPSMNYTFK